VRINGQPGLACHTHLDIAREGSRDGVIEVEPMGNMPVIKDLIVDMDAVHWKKIQRVTPWLINKEPIPEREYIVPHENMVDVTQSMACIQCGACVSDCLSMEVDPLFIGPAALAKAYRFVGDPRDAQQFERLKDLAEDPAGIYDCTHCFKCIEACPKGVAPMNQIMRLRRRAGSDHHIVDRNNGERHERAITYLVRDYGLLYEAEMLPRSYGGYSWFAKFHPSAGMELVDSLPVITKALLRRKVTPGKALRGHKIPGRDLKAVKRIFDSVESHDDRYELNLYITGYDEDETGAETGSATAGADGSGMSGAEAGQPGQSPEESPTR
jgi:succinate dehydrogenase / fumarate reductase iron-sulfur subunit